MNNIGKEFIEKTKYKYHTGSDQMAGVQQPQLESEYDKTKSFIDLPQPKDISVNIKDVRKAIESRRSVRTYSDKPINLNELSYLLWCAQGVKEVIQDHATLRTVPSAGARHAFEIYVLVNNVENLEQGLYRFLAVDHKLIEIRREDKIDDKISDACLDQRFIKSCAVTFFWIAVPYRMNWRYGVRGYRYLFLDAGHSCQNLYLCAESIGCGVCAIAAFSDDDLNSILELDGEEQFVTYLATIGKK
jgi:SagB-type dehydrogenase family enzyme